MIHFLTYLLSNRLNSVSEVSYCQRCIFMSSWSRDLRMYEILKSPFIKVNPPLLYNPNGLLKCILIPPKRIPSDMMCKDIRICCIFYIVKCNSNISLSHFHLFLPNKILHYNWNMHHSLDIQYIPLGTRCIDDLGSCMIRVCIWNTHSKQMLNILDS